jgi:hypothetical protein
MFLALNTISLKSYHQYGWILFKIEGNSNVLADEWSFQKTYKTKHPQSITCWKFRNFEVKNVSNPIS